MTTSTLEIYTAWGCIRVALAAGRVVGCRLPRVSAHPSGAPAVNNVVRKVQPGDVNVADRAETFVRALLAGRPASCPPVELPRSGPFIQRAWQALARVRRGQVISYGDLARQAGSARAVRAAGQACATNELPLFIPCHRVVGAGGRLGGFTGGLAWKRYLLAREGVEGVGA